MNRSKTFTLAYVIFAAATFMTLLAQPAIAARYSGTQPISFTPPYGYVTTQPPGGDTTIDVLALQKWDTSTGLTKNWRFNPSGCTLSSPPPGTTCQSLVSEAAAKWRDVRGAATPNFQYLSPDITTKPSMFLTICGTGTSATNSVNEVGFCNTTGLGGLAAVRTNPSFFGAPSDLPTLPVCDPASVALPCTVVEADMVFNIQTWQVSSLRNKAVHEFGHWMSLGDLYLTKAMNICSGTGSDPDGFQTMCSDNDKVNFGDKGGARLLYPKVFSYSLTTNTVKGSDVAIANIDGTSNKDLLAVWGDFVSPSTTIKVKPFWNIVQPSNIDPPTDTSDPTNIGEPTTVGTMSSLFTVSVSTTDVGATFANVDGDATLDLVITYTDSVSAKYKIFFDITRSVDGITWTSSTSTFSIPGSEGDLGTDVEVFDVTGDGLKDLLIMDTFNNLFWYYIGKTLSTSGTVSTWNTGASSSTLAAFGSYLGGATLDSTTRRINIVYKDNVNLYPKYQTIQFNTGDTAPISASMNKFGPLNKFSSEQGIGNAADNLDPNYSIQTKWTELKEQFIARVESGTLKYTIDWQSRQNSHG